MTKKEKQALKTLSEFKARDINGEYELRKRFGSDDTLVPVETKVVGRLSVYEAPDGRFGVHIYSNLAYRDSVTTSSVTEIVAASENVVIFKTFSGSIYELIRR